MEKYYFKTSLLIPLSTKWSDDLRNISRSTKPSMYLKKELFVSISFYCFTILILGIIILNGGRRGLSEKNTYFVVDAVFHVMRKALLRCLPNQGQSATLTVLLKMAQHWYYPQILTEHGHPHLHWAQCRLTFSCDYEVCTHSLGGIDCSFQSQNWFSLNV